MIKDIIKSLKPSSTLLINEVSNKMEKEGKKVFKFGFGQSPFKVPEDVVTELKNHAHHPLLGTDIDIRFPMGPGNSDLPRVVVPSTN